MTKRETVFTKDSENNKLTVVRSFGAPLAQVWKAWTTSEILDQWWAPKPYQAKTKSMDFREGGMWLYLMDGPDGDGQWCRADYEKIDPQERFSYTDGFCDENGTLTGNFPSMHWKNEFSQTGDETTVTVEINFDKKGDMETVMQMGFQEGFTAGLGNLDDYFNAQ